MVLEPSLFPKRQPRLASSLDTSLLSKYIEEYIWNCQIESKSKKTVESYTRVLKRFYSVVGEVEPTATDVRFFLLSLQESGLKSSTIAKNYRALKTFLNWMSVEKKKTGTAIDNIKSPKLPRIIIQPFSVEDISNMMILTSGNTFLELRNRAIILVFLDTGIRLEEMSVIRLEDLNREGESIKIQGKGNKERLVRVGKVTQKALMRYLGVRGDESGPLWLTEERKPMQYQGFKIMLRRICKAAVVSGARGSAHTFRHTFAINYLRNGGTEFTLQMLLGHTTLTMTRHYVESLGALDTFKIHQKASPVDNLRGI